jgi:hypothetical protein
MNKENFKTISYILLAFISIFSAGIIIILLKHLNHKNKKIESKNNLEKGNTMPIGLDDAAIAAAIAAGVVIVGVGTYFAIKHKVSKNLENLYPMIRLKKRDLISQDIQMKFEDVEEVKQIAEMHVFEIMRIYDQMQKIKGQLVLQLKDKFESERWHLNETFELAQELKLTKDKNFLSNITNKVKTIGKKSVNTLDIFNFFKIEVSDEKKAKEVNEMIERNYQNPDRIKRLRERILEHNFTFSILKTKIKEQIKEVDNFLAHLEEHYKNFREYEKKFQEESKKHYGSHDENGNEIIYLFPYISENYRECVKATEKVLKESRNENGQLSGEIFCGAIHILQKAVLEIRDRCLEEGMNPQERAEKEIEMIGDFEHSKPFLNHSFGTFAFSNQLPKHYDPKAQAVLHHSTLEIIQAIQYSRTQKNVLQDLNTEERISNFLSLSRSTSSLSYSSANHNADRIEESNAKQRAAEAIFEDIEETNQIIAGFRRAEEDRDNEPSAEFLLLNTINKPMNLNNSL